MSQRKIMLTGGGGFIGSHLTRALLAENWRVDVVDDLSTGSETNIPDGVDFYQLDLTRPEDVSSLPQHQYDAICHLAGQSSGEKSFDNPAYDLDANTRSTVLLAQWALDYKVPTFLHASSMGVYGQPTNIPVKEDASLRPLSWYGASKASAEQVLSVASLQGLRTVSFRMFSIYGPGQNLSDLRQGMVSIYLSMLLKELPITVKGSLERVRDFVYIDDCIRAWMLALTSNISGVYNLGTGHGTQIKELLQILFQAASVKSDYPVETLADTPGDQSCLFADCTKLQKATGWKPVVSLPEGIRQMVKWAQG